MADGGNVEFVEIDGPVVYLRWVGGWRLGLQWKEKGHAKIAHFACLLPG